MKQYIIIFQLIITFTLGAFGQNIDSLFSKANEYYSNEAYNDAILCYQQIMESNHYSASVFYNMGNAFFKMGNYPKSILNYEKALLLDPKNEDIKFNLELSKTYLVDKIEEIPDFFLKTWIENLGILFSSNVWLIISVSTFIIALVMLLVFLFSNMLTLKKLGFALSVILLFLSLVSFLYSKQQSNKLFNNSYAILYEPTVTVKGSPSDSGTDLFVLHEGTKVEVLKDYNGWNEIKISNGNKGWVESDMLLPVRMER